MPNTIPTEAQMQQTLNQVCSIGGDRWGAKRYEVMAKAWTEEYQRLTRPAPKQPVVDVNQLIQFRNAMRAITGRQR